MVRKGSRKAWRVWSDGAREDVREGRARAVGRFRARAAHAFAARPQMAGVRTAQEPTDRQEQAVWSQANVGVGSAAADG